jgi:integrase
VAERWHLARKRGWSDAYGRRIWARVEGDLCTELGEIAVEQVDSQALLAALRKIEARGSIETARRIRAYAEDLFRFARAEKLVTSNPAAELGDALSAAPPVKHRVALKARELPAFLAALHSYDGDQRTRLALLLTLLTFVRTNETRFARWEEFEQLNGPEPTWRIPAERMKMRNEHLVPLSRQAVSVLKLLRGVCAGGAEVFPAATAKGVMSENTMLFALYRLGYHDRATVHGFRGTASTILNEQGFNRDWIERQLAHVDQDQVRAAYNSAQWLPERRRMMQWWADHLDAARNACP